MANYHERPGVYSSYEASSILSSASGGLTIAAAAVVPEMETGGIYHISNYAEAVSAFGESCPMTEIIKVLYQNGASGVVACPVGGVCGPEDYEAAFTVLEAEDVSIIVCDSHEPAIQTLLMQSVLRASENRRERIAFVGMENPAVSDLTARAAALGSERMVLVGPDAYASDGQTLLGGCMLAAAAAAAVAGLDDAATPVSGAALKGFGGISQNYDDNQIDVLVRGGVTPVESVAGVISVVRGITTRTQTGGAADATWRELTTTLIIDDVIPALRASLRSRFSKSKNNERTRSSIRSQVILELENKVSREIIDGYDSVTVTADSENPTVCVVAFGFTVSHGMNQIHLTANITV